MNITCYCILSAEHYYFDRNNKKLMSKFYKSFIDLLKTNVQN